MMSKPVLTSRHEYTAARYLAIVFLFPGSILSSSKQTRFLEFASSLYQTLRLQISNVKPFLEISFLYRPSSLRVKPAQQRRNKKICVHVCSEVNYHLKQNLFFKETFILSDDGFL